MELKNLTEIRRNYINHNDNLKINKLTEKLNLWKDFIKDTTQYITPHEQVLEGKPIIPVESLGIQRAGQQIFRREILKKANFGCKIYGINDKTFLEAAHIINWR
ncbi:MAG: hypothetical protein ACTSVV_00195 [Promethearchaeota archaeon]